MALTSNVVVFAVTSAVGELPSKVAVVDSPVEQFYAAELQALRSDENIDAYEVDKHLPFCLGILKRQGSKWMALVLRYANDTMAVLPHRFSSCPRLGGGDGRVMQR